MVGRTVSHYRVLEPLGSGGMGTVYRAGDSRLGRQVALKFLPADLTRDRHALDRFQREARAAPALDHQHICTIHDIDEAEGQPFIAMEQLEGRTLKERLQGRPLPTPEIVDLALQLADGLEKKVGPTGEFRCLSQGARACVATSLGGPVRRFPIILAAGCLLWLSLSTILAQEPPPQAHLSAVEVVGAQRLTQAEVVAGLGLRIGTRITLADLEAAADRLVKTGLVSEVSFRYSYRGNDLTAVFTITEAPVNTRVIFDNFAWFTDQELSNAISLRIPAFDGRASDTSQAINQITGALAGLLKQKNLPGQVENLPYLDTRDGTRAHLFKVTGVSLPICVVDFRGVQDALETRVRSETKPLLGREYSRVASLDFLKATLGRIYRQLGYLHARVLDASGRVAEGGSSCAGGVSLSVAVNEGVSYSWKGARWTGMQAFTAAELDALLRLKEGEVADGLKLDADLAVISRVYGRKGYTELKTTPVPRFDETAHTVTFEIAVQEGAQFRMGVLAISGLGEDAARRIESHWRLKAGDVFDADYPSEFISELAKTEQQLLAGFGSAKVELAPGKAEHSVDVTLTFQLRTPTRHTPAIEHLFPT